MDLRTGAAIGLSAVLPSAIVMASAASRERYRPLYVGAALASAIVGIGITPWRWVEIPIEDQNGEHTETPPPASPERGELS